MTEEKIEMLIAAFFFSKSIGPIEDRAQFAANAADAVVQKVKEKRALRNGHRMTTTQPPTTPL